jgi:hypothetical protein
MRGRSVGGARGLRQSPFGSKSMLKHEDEVIMRTVEAGKPTAPEAWREKMLRWAFWTFFLLATLGALFWKTAYLSAT